MSNDPNERRPDADATSRSAWAAMAYGARQCCPACGRGRLFRAFLKVADRCPHCAEELSHHRADDAPAYFTMVIVGHIVVAGILATEQAFAPPTWVQLAIWLPLLTVMSLLFLPRVKGALIGLQWALRMHGFGGEEPFAEADPSPVPRDA